jgi:hypothetical protein
VLARHPSRAGDVGPQTRNVAPRVPAQISFRNPRSRGTLASRRSTAAIYWPRARLGNSFRRCLRGGVLRPHQAAFAGPARSDGRAVSLGRLPGARLRVAHAGGRIPLRLRLVSGDALGEQDPRNIIHECSPVNKKMFGQRRRARQRRKCPRVAIYSTAVRFRSPDQSESSDQSQAFRVPWTKRDDDPSWGLIATRPRLWVTQFGSADRLRSRSGSRTGSQ